MDSGFGHLGYIKKATIIVSHYRIPSPQFVHSDVLRGKRYLSLYLTDVLLILSLVYLRLVLIY
jgi:hypothetical protein